MEGYYDFTKKVMFSVGVESDTRSKYPIPMTILRYSSVLILCMWTVQTFLYFINDDKQDYFTVQSITAAFFSFQGLVKLLTVIFNHDKLLKITNRLKHIYLKLNEVEKEKSSQYLKKTSNFCYYVFVMQMGCIYMYNSLPFVSFFIAYIKGTEIKRSFSYAIWFWFDPFEYYALVLSAEIYAAHVLMIVQNIFDLFFVLIVADFALHFERLGERIKEVINSSSLTSNKETVKQFHDQLKVHNELILMFNELNGVFEYCLLVQILSSSFVICFAGILIISNDIFYAIPAAVTMLTTLAQTFMPCFFGEMLYASSLKISDEIFSSDFYLLDKKLQKELVFVIQMSQMPLTVKASKFFVLNLSGYTMIIKTAFSYIAVARRVFQ